MSPDNTLARRLADRLLLEVVDAAVADSVHRAGAWCSCRLGCTECCQGPFAINALDAWRLGDGLAILEASDPQRASAVRARARRAIEAMMPGFPGDVATGELGGDEQAEDAFCGKHASLPCPALDPVAGACDLYDWRPISCRTFGPPVRFGAQEVPACRLWFVGASADAVEQARVEPDPDDRERDLLEAVARDGGVGDTFVAFALAAGTAQTR